MYIYILCLYLQVRILGRSLENLLTSLKVYIQVHLAITPSEECSEAGKYQICELIHSLSNRLLYK